MIVRSYDPDEPPTGDGNATGSFVCRPTTGASYFSQHAYGLAIDLNTFQNPYLKGDVVLPELASAYLRRDAGAPGHGRGGGTGDRRVRADRLGVGRRLEQSPRTTSTSARTDAETGQRPSPAGVRSGMRRTLPRAMMAIGTSRAVTL